MAELNGPHTYPTLSAGVGENYVSRGNLIQFPDQHDTPPTIVAAFQ